MHRRIVKVRLKDRTYLPRGGVISEKWQLSLGMAKTEAGLAWFTGLLHDIRGGLRQLRN